MHVAEAMPCVAVPCRLREDEKLQAALTEVAVVVANGLEASLLRT